MMKTCRGVMSTRSCRSTSTNGARLVGRSYFVHHTSLTSSICRGKACSFGQVEAQAEAVDQHGEARAQRVSAITLSHFDTNRPSCSQEPKMLSSEDSAADRTRTESTAEDQAIKAARAMIVSRR